MVPGNTLTDGYVLSRPMLFGTSCRYGYDMIHSERCDLTTRHVIGVWMGVKGKEGRERGVVPISSNISRNTNVQWHDIKYSMSIVRMPCTLAGDYDYDFLLLSLSSIIMSQLKCRK